ncbi:prepilin peptidase [Candidatus Woesearchaeota archaeon]|nr:prepilin peptidase [Candidatus Woesearchaeota archaeon]
MISLVLTIFALILLVIAAYIDIKTREVPNLISYSLIAVALLLKLSESLILNNLKIIGYGLLGFGIFFILSLILYYTKQWGGGDAKLLMGIGAAFYTYPNDLKNILNPDIQNIPFLLTIIVNIFIIGSIYSIIWCFIILIKKKKTVNIISNSIRLIFRSHLKYFWIFSLFFAISFFFIDKSISLFLFIAIVFSLFAAILIFIIKDVEIKYLIKEIPVQKLTEGDWTIGDIKINNRVIYKSKNTGISKSDIERLKNLKLKKVLIKEGIPFVPAITLGVIASLFVGNLILIIT